MLFRMSLPDFVVWIFLPPLTITDWMFLLKDDLEGGQTIQKAAGSEHLPNTHPITNVYAPYYSHQTAQRPCMNDISSRCVDARPAHTHTHTSCWFTHLPCPSMIGCFVFQYVHHTNLCDGFVWDIITYRSQITYTHIYTYSCVVPGEYKCRNQYSRGRRFPFSSPASFMK